MTIIPSYAKSEPLPPPPPPVIEAFVLRLSVAEAKTLRALTFWTTTIPEALKKDGSKHADEIKSLMRELHAKLVTAGVPHGGI